MSQSTISMLESLAQCRHKEKKLQRHFHRWADLSAQEEKLKFTATTRYDIAAERRPAPRPSVQLPGSQGPRGSDCPRMSLANANALVEERIPKAAY